MHNYSIAKSYGSFHRAGVWKVPFPEDAGKSDINSSPFFNLFSLGASWRGMQWIRLFLLFILTFCLVAVGSAQQFTKNVNSTIGDGIAYTTDGAQTWQTLTESSNGLSSDFNLSVAKDGTEIYVGHNNGLDISYPPKAIPIPAVSSVNVNEVSQWAVFEVTGDANQLISLSVTQDTGAGFATLGTPVIQSWTGTAWSAYTTGTVAIPSSKKLFVRVKTEAEQDDIFEGNETFKLVAKNEDDVPGEGTGTIDDRGYDGNGAFWIGDGFDPAPGNTPRDDDRKMTIKDVTVNEGSPYVVVEILGEKGELSLADLKFGNGEGFAKFGSQFSIEYWSESESVPKWIVPTVEEELLQGFIDYGRIYLRFGIKDEQDLLYETSEIFEISGRFNNIPDPVTNIVREFTGTVTIVDDGTGEYWRIEDGIAPSTPQQLTAANILLDDDRELTVNDVSVNEGSDRAVFQVTGTTGQLVVLDLEQGSGTGFANLGSTPAIETWNATAKTWEAYTVPVFFPSASPLYVRVNIEAEQDLLYETAETFNLVARNAGQAEFKGTATIRDDGTGNYWIGDATIFATNQELSTAQILLKDDRIRVNLPIAKEGSSYSGSISATPSSGVTYTANGLPSGLSLSSSGVLSGTPSAGTAGQYHFTVTATNELVSSTGYYTLTVVPATPYALYGWGKNSGKQISGVNTDPVASPLLIDDEIS